MRNFSNLNSIKPANDENKDSQKKSPIEFR